MSYDIFLINSIVPVVLAFVLIVNGHREARVKLFLSVVMLNVAFSFFITHQYLSGNYELYKSLHSFGVMSILFVYPSFYQYVYFLTGQKQFRYKVFLPGLLFGIGSVLVFHGMLNDTDKIYFLSTYRTNPARDTLALQVNMAFRLANTAFLFIQIIWFYFKIHQLLKKYHAIVANTFSSTWDLELNWVRLINYTFIISACACIAFYLVNPVKLFGSDHALNYPFYALAFVMSLLGALGVSQREPDSLVLEQIREVEAATVESTPVSGELMERITRCLETERVYLDPNLTINQLAYAVGTNRTYISQSINRASGLNFSQFVNQYRVKAAKEFMIQDDCISLEDIATKSGFGSFSSFARTFKENEGISPATFRKQQASRASSLVSN